MPCPIEDLDELTVAGGLLCFMHPVGGAEHLVEIGNDGRIAELGEVTDVDFHISRHTVMVVHDQNAGPWLFTVRVR